VEDCGGRKILGGRVGGKDRPRAKGGKCTEIHQRRGLGGIGTSQGVKKKKGKCKRGGGGGGEGGGGGGGWGGERMGEVGVYIPREGKTENEGQDSHRRTERGKCF